MKTPLESTAIRLSLTEVSVGTLAHVLKVPGAGQALSLNQGYLLTLLLFRNGGEARQCFECSGVAATIKALASAVPQPGAILSIGMQGLLYSVGAGSLGSGVIGAIAGITLLSAWAFIQPAITMAIFFGAPLLDGILAVLSQWRISPRQALAALGALWLLKSMIGAGLVMRARAVAARHPVSDEPVILPRARRPLPRLLKLKPLFLLSTGLTIYFLVHSKASTSLIVWTAVRAFGLLFVFATLARSRWFGQAMLALVSRFEWGRRIVGTARATLAATQGPSSP